MGRYHKKEERGGLRIGDRVRTTQRFRENYPKNRALVGVLMWFCIGTEARVKFDNLKTELQMDERWLERVNLNE